MNTKFDENWQSRTFIAADFLRFVAKMSLLDQLIVRNIAEAAEEWFVDLKLEERSPRTIRFYRQHLKDFIKAFPENQILAQMTPGQVKLYLAKAQGEGNHPFYHHGRYRTLRAFFNWAKKQNYIASSPLTIKPPKLPETIPPTFSESDVRAMLKECRTNTALRDKAIIMTLLDTGMRLGELIRMKLSDIEIDGRIITVAGKGRKYRRLKVSVATLRALWAYLKSRNSPYDNIWLSEERRPLTESGVEQMIERVCNKAGITGTRCSPHTFRHTFACNFLENGGDSLDLQYLLGHSTLKMVENYSRATKARRALKAHERFSPVERLGLK